MPSRDDRKRHTRRSILKLGAGLGIAGAAPNAVGQVRFTARDETPGARRPRNIIFMVSDGMSLGVPTMADSFSQLLRNQTTHWHTLASDSTTTRGYLGTRSLNSPVTDSSAAASAWGAGSMVFNGAVNTLPDGTELTPLAQLTKQTGRSVGLVTTTSITHATPAGFAAIHPSRDAQYDIAPQYMNCVDVLLGGGSKYFDQEHRPDRADLAATYREAGYNTCTTRSTMLSAPSNGRLLGLFSSGHMPYIIDADREPDVYDDSPSLAEMTGAALARLNRNHEGFLLQVEGGRVDHAAHDNDAAGLLREQIAFDDALGVVLGFVRDNPDTLLVVTTDHGNANPGLNGYGSRYKDSGKYFERLMQADMSVETMLARLGGLRARPSVDDVIDVIKAHTGATLNQVEASAVAASVAGRCDANLSRQLWSFPGVVGAVLGNFNGVTWTGVSHTSDLAPVLAFGPGGDAFGTIQHHTGVFSILTEAFGIDHVNPSMTVEAAARFASMMHEPDHLKRRAGVPSGVHA